MDELGKAVPAEARRLAVVEWRWAKCVLAGPAVYLRGTDFPTTSSRRPT